MQKHIKVADRLDNGWATMQHYDTHPLASDSDVEKRLEKAQREVEQVANKQYQGGNAAVRKCRNWGDSVAHKKEPKMAAASSSGAGSLANHNQARLRVEGPCFRCAAWGHLAANCPPKDKLYPFCQSVVRETDKLKVSVCDSIVSVNSILPCEDNTESADQGVKSLSEMCVNALKAEVLTGADCHQPSEQDSEDIDFSLSEEGEQGIIQFWELESQESGIQMTDVQGRLRKNLPFWKESRLPLTP